MKFATIIIKNALIAFLGASVASTAFASPPAVTTTVHYIPQDLAQQAELRLLAEQGVLTKLTRFVDRNFKLEQPLQLQFYQGAELFFDAQSRAMLIPVSTLKRLYDNVASKYPQQREVRHLVYLAAVEHLLWYQLGQALVNQFDLQIRGRESYSLDSFAALMLLSLNELRSDYLLDAVEEYLLALGSSSLLAGGSGTSEAEQDEIRYRLIVCLVLGLDFENQFERVEGLAWGEDELAECQDRYWQTLTVWHQKLKAHLKPGSDLARWQSRALLHDEGNSDAVDDAED